MFAITFTGENINGGYVTTFLDWDERKLRMELVLKDLMDRGYVVTDGTHPDDTFTIARRKDGGLETIGYVNLTLKF